MKREKRKEKISILFAHCSLLPVTFYLFTVLCSLLIVLCSCSSAPRRPPEVFYERTAAHNQLNMADRAANQGFYNDALIFISEARRLALATDDPQLRIETLMSRANILFSLGNTEEAFRDWEEAAYEADASDEKELAALARIQSIRASLMLLENDDVADADSRAAVEELKTRIIREMAVFGKGSHRLAAGYVVLGIAEMQTGRWADAENEVKKALEIHERNNFLEDSAYDWFLIASIRSQAGDYDGSLDALKTSIDFDRRAENSFGLATSWQAMGSVYNRAGRIDDSRSAYRRSAEIFRAMGHIDRAERLEAQL